MSSIDIFTYVNQLLTSVVFSIDNKIGATVFTALHSSSNNPSIKMYLQYLEEYYGINEDEIKLINECLERNDYKQLNSLNPLLFHEVIKQSSSETKEEILLNSQQFKKEDISCIQAICQNEVLNKKVIEQQKKVNNIQQALMILKDEVVKTQLKISYNPNEQIQTQTLPEPNIPESRNIFIFQIFNSGYDQKRIEELKNQRIQQLKNSLKDLNVVDFWEGYGSGLLPKIILVVIEELTTETKKDIESVHSLYPSSKIYLIYLYKKIKIQHIESNEISLHFDIQKKEGLFELDNSFLQMAIHCFN
ncbi:hypothetical protein EHI8A_145090 [Entamoeba histolytica HM-1:IMSS-B]|uniref:Uncharacterized protein n=6 Tax=Entamoeba histolytica TaxID=5759 RepID=C4M4F9_ENTH1|nr:hypothetical protein EHI_041940 [Entamoeba histolytica HM-1:IMSS]EMD45419.1 Hypothetical protein EHI5A_175830 [Entamoeba histolytica KU27]EMH74382.1 hypothetical protein EHI8A_145090 [Entamoeba histolytica HM-1:IMSS-B]EMS15575.1 hypothetical protein KM1_219740 [Entamoeba histolytica HM-3:IMSS]ENY60491.1 hypothetical protein EHI7A_132030 [Entamoeba histolytica HM-1:IMSS-A]GAT96258.1 hypothetical protein CL6EHI_041940 [Entamoeba histolytica]|eukprot:XP_656528.1 hypothetical protein EHI_041940 [Entamoeba histolytica HM-1:IMSS]